MSQVKANTRLHTILWRIVLLSLVGLVAFAPFVQAQKPTPPPVSQPPEPTKPPPEPTQALVPTKEPTSTAKPPPIEPTKEPTETPLPTPTPVPARPVDDPTPTPDPTKPMVEPTPTSDPAKPTVEPTPTSDPARPAVAPAPTGEQPSGVSGTLESGETFDGVSTGVVTSPLVVTGIVFDDRDGDGRQGSGEPGIGGVPVVVDGQVAGVTGAGGTFHLPVPGRGRALLSIVPPEGWQWQGEPMNVEGENVAIPLRRLEPEGASDRAVKAASTATVAGSVIVVVLLAFSGVASLLQTMAVRSLTHTYRQQKAQEMEYRQYQVIARRKAEIEQMLAETGDWRQVLNQVIADAVPGASPTWLTVTDVSTTPVPRFDVVGEDGKRYTFTISPGAIFLWRMRAIPLDASLSPAARVEVQAVWEYLTEQQELELPLLPRQAEWYLIVRESKKGAKTRR